MPRSALERAFTLVALALISSALTTPRPAEAGGTLRELGDLAGRPPRSEVVAISGDGGVIVGNCTSVSGREACRWTAPTGWVGLGDLPGGVFSSRAVAASTDGSVVAGVATGASGPQAVRWTNGGAIEPLGVLPGTTTCKPLLVSADGSTVAGTCSSPTLAFRWTAATGMTEIPLCQPTQSFSRTIVPHGLSADGSVVVGVDSTAFVDLGFRWSANTPASSQCFGPILGDSNVGDAKTTADGGVLVGTSVSFNDQSRRAFSWTPAGGIQALPLPPGRSGCDAAAVSPDGAVAVGQCGPQRRSNMPFDRQTFVRWVSGAGGFTPQDLGLPGGVLGCAFGDLSDDGVAVIARCQQPTLDVHVHRWQMGAGWADLGPADLSSVAVSSLDAAAIAWTQGQHILPDFEQVVRWTAGGGIEELGDLPGGPSLTFASALSADGQTVVGSSASDVGQELFHWTSSSGLVGLGGRPGPPFDAQATSVSAPGRFIGVASGAYPDGAYVHDIGPDSLAGTGDDAQILLPLVAGACAATQVSQDGASVLFACDGKLRLWRPGPPETATDIPLPAGLAFASTRCSGRLSLDGSTVAGDCLDSVGNAYDTFRWTQASGTTSLGVDSFGGQAVAALSADGSVVVGGTVTSIDFLGRPNWTPFRWTSSRGLALLPAPPGGGICAATSLSSSGQRVVGTCFERGSLSFTYPSTTWLFEWTPATGSVDLGFPHPSGPLPLILSADGSTLLTGSACQSNPIGTACLDLWLRRADDPSFRSLRMHVLPGEVPADWTRLSPAGLSNDGLRLAGSAIDAPGDLSAFHVELDPLPPFDGDGDGAADLADNCPFAPNPDQKDTGGVGAGSPPDGIGDACQCGDVDGSGRVTLTDAVILTRSLLAPPTATQTKPELCDTGGTAGCTLADAVSLRRAVLVPPTASLQQQCAPARQPGEQVCGDGVRTGTETCDGGDGCVFSCVSHCTRCHLEI